VGCSWRVGLFSYMLKTKMKDCKLMSNKNISNTSIARVSKPCLCSTARCCHLANLMAWWHYHCHSTEKVSPFLNRCLYLPTTRAATNGYRVTLLQTQLTANNTSPVGMCGIDYLFWFGLKNSDSIRKDFGLVQFEIMQFGSNIILNSLLM